MLKTSLVHWTDAAKLWGIKSRQAVRLRGVQSGKFSVVRGFIFIQGGAKDGEPAKMEDLQKMKFQKVGNPGTKRSSRKKK